ncbi:alpha/beta hydrolase [Alkalibacterium pelagium]|uniref:S-formylglutathione hydrolase FrmB n=1 Tax=Alkalibacterium pelagium TaxID=426702 RepID=A0A1H7PTF2_9LACT|nr:alpha/beta hydrolase family protein [Alkalibacterium pelagium]GEN51698.1 alpha-xylosidase [Alkalibacterium pelagium]SEL38535.1 S-formylglutathione hydrolase FrmB [Alkalibacterium pelagium]
MAVVTVSFQSRELMRSVQHKAIIPTSTKSLYDPDDAPEVEMKDLRTLYLLHGWDGSHEDWINNTRIIELATKYGIAVIMPSGENSFYVDHPNGNNYGKFIGEELIDETRKLFPLSKKRDDTWIAGLSMGGYGALRNGIYYSDKYSKIAAFSSRIRTSQDKEDLSKVNPITQRTKAIIKGDSYKALPEDMDIKKLVNASDHLPELYIVCGTEDFLINENRKFHKWLDSKQIEHHYEEESGKHDWDYWNIYIERALEWLT